MRRHFFLALALLFLLAACAGTAEEMPPDEIPQITPIAPSPPLLPTPTPTPTPSPTPIPEPVDKGINPLNGLPMDEAVSDRRPLAVMYNNLKAALPMYGISKADLIYEALAEGGITRVMGFYKNPALVPRFGSIRSTRAYYLDIAQAHDAILMHAGGSPEALNLIVSRKLLTLDGIRYDGSMCYRDAERKRTAGLEHSLFAKGEDVDDTIVKLKSRIIYGEDYNAYDAFSFADKATPEGGTKAESVSIVFSQYKTGVFDYDADEGMYYVSQYGKPMTDGETGEQLCVKNVLVLYTDVSVIKGDSAGRLTTRMTGTGNGLFICDGKSEEISWSKDSPNSPYVYTQKDGQPLKLARGVSYINIVPKDAKIELT